MLNDYFEPFALLESREIPDGQGGTTRRYRDVAHFGAALCRTASQETSVSGRMVLRHEPVLLHDAAIDLTPGDRLRREKDGSLWRVRTPSADLRAPAPSSLPFAQVTLERLPTA